MVIVAIECASWYQREDGLIQVITIRGKTVILSAVFRKIQTLTFHGGANQEQML